MKVSQAGMMTRLQQNPSIRNPGAVAASVERKRYGMGSKMPSFHGMSQSKSFRKGSSYGVPKSANKGDKFY